MKERYIWESTISLAGEKEDELLSGYREEGAEIAIGDAEWKGCEGVE